MQRILPIANVLIVLFLLSGCGGGGGSARGGEPPAFVDPRLAVIDAFDEQRQRVSVLPLTDPATLPTSGSVDFTGSASIRVETAPVSSVFVGDALITISFGSGGISGEVDNFFGTNPAGDLRDYDGKLLLNNGVTENAWSADYAGELSAGSDRLVLNGTINGEFLGQPVAAISGADLEVGLRYNGDDVDATMVVVGERG